MPLLTTASVVETTSSIFKRFGLSKQSGQPSTMNSTLRQSNLLFIRLDILSIFLSQYSDLRDICIKEDESESEASASLTELRDAMVGACLDSITSLIDNAGTDHKDSLPVSINSSNVADDAVTDDFNSCDMSATTGHIISFSREIFKYQRVYCDLMECAQSIGSRLVYSVPASVPEFTSDTHSALLSALESRYASFDADGMKKAVRVSRDHALHSAGVPEANERLRAACKHLYFANNICPLYLLLKEAASVGFSPVVTLGDDREKLSLSEEFLAARQRFLSVLETRLKFESTRFVDTIVESTGIMDVLDELEKAGGPAALLGNFVSFFLSFLLSKRISVTVTI